MYDHGRASQESKKPKTVAWTSARDQSILLHWKNCRACLSSAGKSIAELACLIATGFEILEDQDHASKGINVKGSTLSSSVES